MNNKLMLLGAILIANFVISGCAHNREMLTPSSFSTRNDIFSEDSNPGSETNKAIMDINFSVKSISSRFFEIYYKHEDPPFQVYFNIDGQTTILDSEPTLEKKLPFDPNMPETGTGWRYIFNKRISLNPGKHKLSISIPVDDVFIEKEIELHTGVNTVNLAPIYKKRSSQRPYKTQNFSAGVKTLEVSIR